MVGPGEEGNGELVFNRDRVSVEENEKVLEGWWGWLHRSVNVLHVTELFT